MALVRLMPSLEDFLDTDFSSINQIRFFIVGNDDRFCTIAMLRGEMAIADYWSEGNKF
ncbi:MAG: hypothetical protein HC799_18365 [Limnothrix sp. RL_2_0]|nr:hypothetical protein [Limnothrix sp. RL_2_0]